MWTFYYSNYDIILCYQAWLDRNSLLTVLQLTSYRVTLLGESPATVSKLLLKITIENAQIASFTFAHVYTSQQTGIKILVLLKVSKFGDSPAIWGTHRKWVATRRRQALFFFTVHMSYTGKSRLSVSFCHSRSVYPQNALKLLLGVLDEKIFSGFGDLPATPGTMQNVWRLAGDNFKALVQVATRRRPRCVAGDSPAVSWRPLRPAGESPPNSREVNL